MKELSPNLDHWKQHYIEYYGKPFYIDLCSTMADKPVIAMCIATISEEPCWKICREILESTDPAKAEKHTIRGQYGTSARQNVAHVSDSAESAERELQLWRLI